MSKNLLSQNEAKNYSESFLFFSTGLNRERSLGKFDLMETTFFGQASEMGQILMKTVFLLIIRHLLLN